MARVRDYDREIEFERYLDLLIGKSHRHSVRDIMEEHFYKYGDFLPKKMREALDGEIIQRELDDLIKIQKKNISNEYMRGLCNGLICARSIMSGKDPKYVEKRTSRRKK